MTDYTPTTEEVRKAYLSLRGGMTWYEGKADAIDAQFDRWLAEVKREVWDDAVNQVIATVRCDSEDVTWVNKNPYRQRECSENSSSQPTAETSNLLNKGEI